MSSYNRELISFLYVFVQPEVNTVHVGVNILVQELVSVNIARRYYITRADVNIIRPGVNIARICVNIVQIGCYYHTTSSGMIFFLIRQ